jgi:hypothetical protein
MNTGFKHHIHTPWKALALATALLIAVPAHAALTTLTLGSGLQANQDDASGLLWHAFETPVAGEQAGFRAATAQEFAGYLVSAGYGVGADGSWSRVGKPVPVVSGLDLYSSSSNDLAWLGYHDAAYYGWVDSKAGRQLVSMSDELRTVCDAQRYCVSTTTSIAKFGDLASALGPTFVPSESNMWRYGDLSVSAVKPDAPNFIMVQTAVPEPTTYVLMGLGLVGIAGVRARRSKPDA